MELLNKHYARVLTLKEWLCNSLEDKGHISSSLLNKGTEYESYEGLLTSVYVCEETEKCKLPSFTLSHYHQQKEIVLTAIERILSKKGYGKNVLTYGFCLMSPDPFALSCGVNVESRYPNSSVNRLFYPAWEMLLSRTGDAVMMYLLEHTSVFQQVTSTCMVQISGTPLNNLPERASQGHNRPKTSNTAKQTHHHTNADGVKSIKRGSKEKDLRTDREADEVYDIIDLKEDNVSDLIDPKEKNSRKGSICNFTHAEGTDRNDINKQRDGETIGEVIENLGHVDVHLGNKRKSGMNKRTNNKCKRYKQSKNTMEKSGTSKRMKKFEDISEKKYQELKRRSVVYAMGRKEGDPNILSEDCCLGVAQVKHRDGSTISSPDNVSQRKRKFCDTSMYIDNSDEMEADCEARESKRKRLQSQNEFESDCSLIDGSECNGSECNTVDVIGQDDNKECEINIAERDKCHKHLGERMYGDQTAKKWKRQRHSKITKDIKTERQFCPFEFHLPLPRNNILLARNPREAFPKSVILARLDATPEDIVLLYKQIYCEMKVISDTEAIRVNCPCLNDVQVVLGIPEDQKTEEGLEGGRQQNHNSYLINHQSFWNNSVGGNTFLSDLAGACVPSEISHVGVHMLGKFPSSDRQNEKPDLSAITAGVNNHNNESNTFWKVVNNTKSCQPSDIRNIDITEVLGKDSIPVATGSVASGSVASGSVASSSVASGSVASSSVASGSVASGSFVSVGTQGLAGKEKSSCGSCINRSSKEELLAKRKHEIIMSRKCSSLNRFVVGECENLGQQVREEMELNKEDKNFSRNSLWSSNSSHLTTKISSMTDAIMPIHRTSAVIFEVKDGEKSFKIRTSPEQGQDSIQIRISSAQGKDSSQIRTSLAQELYSSQIRTSPAQGQDSSQIRTSPAQEQDSSQIRTSPVQEQDSSQLRTSPAQVMHSCQVRTSPVQELHSCQVRTSPVQGLCTSQQSVLHDLPTSQLSEQCAGRQRVKIPAFTDVTLLLKQLLENHRSCPFKALVNYHCPVVCKKAGSRLTHRNRRDAQRRRDHLGMSQLLKNHHHHRKVYLFLRACIMRVVPLELLGKKHNFNILLKNVSNLISLGKYDRLTLGQVMLGIKTSEVEWLSSTSSNSAKLHMLAKLILWLFGYILGIMKTFFYITDTGFLRYRLLYYRQVTWNKLHSFGINGLIKRKILKVISEEKAWEMLQGRKSLGLSLLRFLPKQKSLRPIINMGSTVTLSSFKTLSVNKQLLDLHSILKYLKARNPSLIGYGKLGNDDIYEAWKLFVNRWKKLGSPKLNFVKTDISNCYDSVMQDKLYSIMEDILNTEMSDEEFIIRKYFTVSMQNGCVKRKFNRVVTPMSEFNPDFMSYSREIAESKGLKNTIFVDKVVYQHETSESQLKLLKQHLFNNLVKVGSSCCLQTCGISQGSVISTLLCSFYYAQMEKSLFELSEGEFLMRIVDDYLYVTPSQEHATSFLETMVKSVPEYNCYVNQEKILTNFAYSANLNLPSVSTEWFPWCGVLFNTETLEISMDFTKYSGCSIRDTMTMELSKTPGLSLKEKIVFSVRQKCHALYIDETINSKKQMLENIYQLFLFAVFKLHVYIQTLPHKQRADNNTTYFLDVIRQMVYAVDCLVKNNVGESGRDISSMANWLCLKACSVKLSCHHASYKKLLKELSKQLECKQKCLALEEETLLRNIVEPSMPVAFKYFLT